MIKRLLSLMGLKRIDDSHALAKLISGYETDSGIQVTTTAALQNAAVYTCVRIISDAISSTPVSVYEKDGDNINELPSSKLARIVSLAPNEFQSAKEFWDMVAMHLLSDGNFYAWKNKVNGELRELLPLHYAGVEPKWTADKRIVYVVTFIDGSQNVYSSDDIFHLRYKHFDPNSLKGLSPIGWHRETIGYNMGLNQHGSRTFKNGTRLSGVLSTDQVLGDASFDLIKKSWNETYSGIENASKVAILEKGLKFQGITMNNADAQFLESKKYSTVEICGIYGVPPHKAAQLDRATFNNIEHQDKEFYKDCVKPLFRNIEGKGNISLVERRYQGRRFIKFTWEMEGDQKSQGEYYNRMITSGVLSPNEVRKKLGMNPRDGGDSYLTPINMAIDGKVIGASDEGGEYDNSVGLKESLDSYGQGVRSGAITPQADDEKHFREKMGLPEQSDDVTTAWTDDGGVRRPVTLKSEIGFQAEQSDGANENDETI